MRSQCGASVQLPELGDGVAEAVELLTGLLDERVSRLGDLAAVAANRAP